MFLWKNVFLFHIIGKQFLHSFLGEENIFTGEGSEKMLTSTMKIPVLQITSRCHVMALIWIIDYSVISAIWTRIWHPSFRYEIPEKDRLIFFIKMAQKIITDLLNLSTNNVFMCIHSMTFFKQFEYLNGYKHACFTETRVDFKRMATPFCVHICYQRDFF